VLYCFVDGHMIGLAVSNNFLPEILNILHVVAIIIIISSSSNSSSITIF
jgi:hypothetical protein